MLRFAHNSDSTQRSVIAAKAGIRRVEEVNACAAHWLGLTSVGHSRWAGPRLRGDDVTGGTRTLGMLDRGSMHHV